MSMKLSQSLRTRAALAPQDITTARTGPFADVAGGQRMLAVVVTGPVAATKKVTAKFLQAQDAAGTGAKDLGSALDTVAPAGGAALSPMIEAKIEDLDTNNGYGFVALNLVSDNASAVLAGASLILGNNRFNP